MPFRWSMSPAASPMAAAAQRSTSTRSACRRPPSAAVRRLRHPRRCEVPAHAARNPDPPAGTAAGGSTSFAALSRMLDEPAAAEAWGRAAGLEDPRAAHRSLVGLAAHGLTLDLLAALCDQLVRLLPAMSDPDRVLVSLERFLGAVRSPLSTGTLFQRDPGSLGTLLKIFSASPHLSDLVIADPEAWEQVRVGQGRPESLATLVATLDAEIGLVTEPECVMRALRRFKRRETLRIAYGDVVVGQRLETVVAQLSHVAEAIVRAAVRVATARMERQRGVPRGPAGERATLAVLALGKLGGGELNYSSDVDLVFVHSADGRVEGPKPCTNQEFFERVVRETVRLIAEATDLGVAHRVDLRLRPQGTAGPPVLSLEATLQYYDRFGRTWERQAWVKGRCIAGDERLGARLLEELEPWIYRRWLTRADISGIKALKRRIEQRSTRAGTDDSDVKHGRGGIRDIEFTIQFLQLLSGGDTPGVRTGNTLEAIRRLAEAGGLTDQEREILERTYTLLRTVEHRLQILYDRQTHVLPASDVEIGRLAVRSGYGRGPEATSRFRHDLAEAAALNRRMLDHLLHDIFPDDAVPEPEVDLVLDPEPSADFVREVLSRHGFRDLPAAYRGLQSLGEEKVRFLSTRRCRHFLAAIAPRLLAAIARTPDPDATLASLGAVSDSLGGKGILWELFSANPPSLELTIRLCSSSPFLTRLLVGNPGMIDELLDSLVVQRLPTQESLDASLQDLCRGAVSIEPILHAFKASQQLRVGVNDILGRQDATGTTAALSGIAEALLRAVVTREETRLVERLGEPMAGEGQSVGTRAGPVVLAMGKFGGREMNYSSDLDVVFLYDADGFSFPTRRTRRSAEGTTNAHFFGELAQRTMRVFNAIGPQGRLYEIDSRLRPSGRSGAAAVSLDDFARYFGDDGPAAAWERQALTKARVVVGSRAAAARALEIVAHAAYGRTWTAGEAESIRRMRQRMEEGARETNLKRGRGGIVDIEFVVQMLQLVHGGADPSLRTPETLAGLVALHAAGHLADGEFSFLQRAYHSMRSIEGRLRLLDAPARHDVPTDPEERRKLAHLLGYQRPEQLAEDVGSLMTQTRRTFDAVFDRTIATLPRCAPGTGSEDRAAVS
ncbi:MAG: bifunctional [glutamate--ammonia ligase]-adenylyl-L-tyrosine phosphorylase/[glutamate--ammonia-ligase] adenylyltransferase [Planctomycetia bacterium]|nr:bifunctional [glutamate--ammonia ligase]-adenylyl-L-tyrosine phosphorylase/[glutamate--ammonia-ligase] adenylyltransferase [Planctomycetia bacterium]